MGSVNRRFPSYGSLGSASDRFRPLLTPAEAGGDEGEDARGEYWKSVSPD